MPDIAFRRTLAALEIATPLDEAGRRWPFRFCPYTRGRYTVLMICNGAAAGQQARISVGTTKVLETSAISVGAADGVLPTPFTAPSYQFDLNKGDELVLEVSELGNVATTDVMCWVNVEPLLG
jgi:hypothetical protein